MIVSSFWRKILVCLSLANLVMMKLWVALIPFSPGNSFWLKYSPANCYWAAMTSTIVIAVVFYTLLHLASRLDLASLVWPFLYGITICFALNGIRIHCNFGLRTMYSLTGTVWLVWVCFAAAVAIVLFLMLRYRHIISLHKQRIALVFVPFVLVTFAHCSYAIWKSEPASAFEGKMTLPHHLIGQVPVPPVVWIVFDEFDYSLVFERRPSWLLLPEIDRMKEQSVFATRASSPFDNTSVSVPALLTGKEFKSSKPSDSNHLLLRSASGEVTTLQKEATVFSDVQKKGGATSIFGWFFPYQRIFTVDSAHSYPTYATLDDSVGKTVLMQLRALVEAEYYSVFGDSLECSNHIFITSSMQRDVRQHFAKHLSGLTFLHYPVPHSLNIYSRKTRKYGSNRNIKEGYLDNLALADRLLGEVRSTMQSSGDWDRSLVIVSSDHHWRSNTYDGTVSRRRVPFMVKMPYQGQPLVYDKPFQTLHTRELISLFIDGKLKNSQDLVQWLESM